MKRIVTLVALFALGLSALIISGCCSSEQTEDHYDLTDMIIQQARLDSTINGQVKWQLEDVDSIDVLDLYGFELSWQDSFVRRLSNARIPIGNVAYACEASYHASLLISDIRSIHVFSLTEVDGLFAENEDVSDYFQVSGADKTFQSDSSSIYAYIIASRSSVYNDFMPGPGHPVVFYLNEEFKDGQELQFEIVAKLQDGTQFRSSTKKVRVKS